MRQHTDNISSMCMCMSYVYVYVLPLLDPIPCLCTPVKPACSNGEHVASETTKRQFTGIAQKCQFIKLTMGCQIVINGFASKTL